MDGSMEMLQVEKARALREQRGGLAPRQERLHQLLEHLGDALGLLEERLQPVLTPPVPTQALRAETAPEESQLAGFLQRITEQAELRLQQVQDLSGRVDL